MSNIYALLTGVAAYHPDADVPPLTGCVHDVTRMEAFLKKTYGRRLRLEKLVNEDVTMAGYQEVFCRHFIHNQQLGEGDIALIYHSGHGSYTASLPEFSGEDLLLRDETLVLYDSRCAGRFDLADKELRLLISMIPPAVEVVVIIDACHSGSITRGERKEELLPHAKLASRGHARTALSDYLTVDGRGLPELLKAGRIVYPERGHLALTACARTELAYEDPNKEESIFTSRMLEVLETTGGRISYTALYEHLYTYLKRWDNRQTPQLKVYGSCHADRVFLSPEEWKSKPPYQAVQQLDGKVTINAGALHGLSNKAESMETLAVQLYDGKDPAAPPAQVRIATVGLDMSELEDAWMNEEVTAASIVNLPPAVCIRVLGSAELTREWQELEKNYSIAATAFVYLEDTFCDFTVRLGVMDLRIYKGAGGELVHGVDSSGADAMQYMLECCTQLAAWQRLYGLRNHALAEEHMQQAMDVRLQMAVKMDAGGEWTWLDSMDIGFRLAGVRRELPFKLRVINHSARTWYCGVYWLGGRYEIKKVSGDIDASGLATGASLASLDRDRRLMLSDGAADVDRYLLIASLTPYMDWLIPEKKGLKPEVAPWASRKEMRHQYRSLQAPAGLHDTWFTRLLTLSAEPGDEDGSVYVRDRPAAG